MSRQKKIKILLVDDEEPIMIIAQRELEHLGYRVTPRTSSLEAYEVFRNDPERFDLIITVTGFRRFGGRWLFGALAACGLAVLCIGGCEDMWHSKGISRNLNICRIDLLCKGPKEAKYE